MKNLLFFALVTLFLISCHEKNCIRQNKVIIESVTGFKAVDDNQALQNFLNQAMGVTLTSTDGERYTGNLVKNKLGSVLFSKYSSSVIIHLKSDEEGVWGSPSPCDVDLLVLVIKKEPDDLKEKAAYLLNKIGTDKAKKALKKLSSSNNKTISNIAKEAME